MNLLVAAVLAAGLPAGAAASAASAQEVRAERVERVRFARGESGATLRGRIHGYRTVDYLVNARAGQRMSVRLRTPGRGTFFIVRAPGSEDNLFDGSGSGAAARLTLPASGDYRIRVLQMRSTARRGERANYSLTVRIER